MPKTNWHAYSGIVSRQLTTQEVIESAAFGVYDIRTGFEYATFATIDETVAYLEDTFGPFWNTLVTIRETVSTEIAPALQRGVAVVPLEPFPIYTESAKVLTTRGYWDVVASSSPQSTVANFAFGMTFLPLPTVLDVEYDETAGGIQYETVSWKENIQELPDPLLDDVGWFVYDSFVRVSTIATNVNQDPPFHSKTMKRIPPNSVLCVIAGVEVEVGNLRSLSLHFGIRFRMLVER